MPDLGLDAPTRRTRSATRYGERPAGRRGAAVAALALAALAGLAACSTATPAVTPAPPGAAKTNGAGGPAVASDGSGGTDGEATDAGGAETNGPAARGPAERGRSERALSSALASAIESVVAAPPLDHTHWGILVLDPATGRTLYARNPDRLFITASNMKLVVSAAAMDKLGPSFRYRTPVYAVGLAPGGVADTLMVVGRGDPTMSSRFYDSDTAALDSLADSIAAAGIRRVRGPLLVDASYFEPRMLHSAWEVGDLDWYYAAPVAAFAIAEGAVGAVLTPTEPGRRARLERIPPLGRVAISGEVVTAPDTARTRIRAERRPGADTLALTGTIRASSAPDTAWLAVGDPVRHAAIVLRQRLEARGIPVDGGIDVVYDTATARTLPRPGARRMVRVAELGSPPLDTIIAGVLQPSQNWIAEMLLKTLGARATGHGSWESGTEAAGRFLVERVGADSTTFFLRDGSGLSAQNLLSPRTVARLLRYTDRAWWRREFRAALATPGAEEHTLEERLGALQGRVFAKTGTIRHVNSLSGFVRARGGRDLIFSILTNGSGLPAGDVRDGIDRIVRAIADAADTGGRP